MQRSARTTRCTNLGCSCLHSDNFATISSRSSGDLSGHTNFCPTSSPHKSMPRGLLSSCANSRRRHPVSKQLIERAFTLAYELHARQIRKASIMPGAPYISHLMEVAGMVLANGGDEAIGAAALLHDAIEDQGVESQARILEKCGAEVLALVLE